MLRTAKVAQRTGLLKETHQRCCYGRGGRRKCLGSAQRSLLSDLLRENAIQRVTSVHSEISIRRSRILLTPLRISNPSAFFKLESFVSQARIARSVWDR